LSAAALTPPRVAVRLAYAGLVPFAMGAALAWLLPPPDSASLELDEHTYALLGLSAYAAVVLAFLGAVHWGRALQAAETNRFAYVWAVLPALIGAVGTVMPAYAGLVLQGLGLLACYGVDRHQYPRWGAQAWLTLRFRCTAVASLCCFLAAAAT